MPQSGEILVLNAENMDDFHFGNIKWNLPIRNASKSFHINKLEDFRPFFHFPLPPHRKEVIDIIYITKGVSVRSKGLNQYEFGANELFVLPAYQITSHDAMSEDIEGYFLHADPQIIQKGSSTTLDFPILDFFTNPVVQIPEEVHSTFLTILKRLENLYQQKNEIDFDLIGYYLTVLLKEISNFSAPSEPKKSASHLILQKYKEALSELIYQKQKVADYAEHLNISPNHLNKCVKQLTGKSAQDILNEMLILEAKSLLKYSDLQIAEIAQKLMNQSPSNFSRFFKTQTGLTPKEYK
ncbi:MAG: hypothetical protein RJA76_1443 [Bacteroidota bacterium]|jgi:AraC-like DNA-binding protein